MLGWWLGATIVISCYQLGAGKSGLYLEVASIGLGVCVLIWLKDNWRKLFAKLHSTNVIGVVLIAANIVYLIWDLVTWTYSSQKSLFLSKYPIVAVTILICIGMLIYIDSFDKLGKIKIWIGSAAIILTLISLINFYLPVLYPLYYSLRLSVRSDYNMFATALYVCGVTLLSQVMKKKDVKIGRLLIQFTTFGMFLAVIVLSGSRRILILLPMWVTNYITILIKQVQNATKNTLYSVAVVLGGIIMASTIAVLLINGVSDEMDRRYKAGENTGIAESSGGEGATSYVQRIQSTREGNFMTKRLVLWSLALKEIASLNGKDLVIGKGGGYSITMYDSINEPLDVVYPNRETRRGALSPHNMVLADPIDGGVIKLALLLTMLLALLLAIMEFWYEYPIKGRLYVLAFTAIVLGSFISNRFGLINDRLYYMFTVLLLIERRLTKEEPDE